MKKSNLNLKKDLFVLIIILCANISMIKSQTNIPGEIGIYNAQLFYYTGVIPFDVETEAVFRPYIYYLTPENTPTNTLMDAFVLYDLDKSGANSNGNDYDIDKLKTYLDDTFVKARMIDLTNDYYYGGLNNQSVSFELAFGGRKSIMQDLITVEPETEYTAAFYGMIESNGSIVSNAGMVGFEIFDNIGVEIKGENGQIGLGGNATWSDYYDYWYTYIDLSDNWQQKIISFETPSSIVKLNLHLSIGPSANEYQNKVYYDYIQLVEGDDNYILSDSELESLSFETLITDGNFEELPTASIWQSSGGKYGRIPLYQDRCSAMEGIKQSILSTEISFNIPTSIKIILMLPHPQDLSDDNIDFYNGQVSIYINEGLNYFNSWKALNTNLNVEFAGWYFTKESLPSSETIYHEFLSNASNIIHNLNHKLIGSPYNYSYTPSINCKYHPDFWPYFDCIWVQPNCWFNPGGSMSSATNVDLDMLKMVGDYVFANNLGINIERKGNLNDSWSQEANLGYGRVLDYFSFGYHTGYVNIAKCYYDAGGQYWNSANSSNIIEREQYDELNKFIFNSKIGFIPNNNFEQIENENQFYLWNGEYEIHENESADFIHGQFSLSCAQNKAASTKNRITVSDTVNYRIRSVAKETGDDGVYYSALIGLKIYDESGNELVEGATGLTWSSYLNMWYVYLPVQSYWESFTFDITMPSGSSSAYVYLKNWNCENDILWDSFEFLINNEYYGPTSQWNMNTPLYIFDNGDPAFTTELISVNGAEPIDFSVMAKESMNDYDPSSALLRIDPYDEQLNLITPSQGDFQGMVWSTDYSFWYKYIDTEVILPPSPPWYESRWILWNGFFTSPENSKWLRCYLYRWTLESENIISFHRPILEIGNITSINENVASNLPTISQNYPNPFSTKTTIHYYLPKNSHVCLKIYNILGEEIATLVNENQKQGENKIIWNGKDSHGNEVSPGIYISQLKTDGIISSSKMLLGH